MRGAGSAGLQLPRHYFRMTCSRDINPSTTNSWPSLGAMWVALGSRVVTCSGKVTAGIRKDVFLLLIHVNLRPGVDPSSASESSHFRGGAAESWVLGGLGVLIWKGRSHGLTPTSLLWKIFYMVRPSRLVSTRSSRATALGGWASQFHLAVLSQADSALVLPGLRLTRKPAPRCSLPPLYL